MRRIIVDMQRNRANRAYIVGNIFTNTAVTASDAANKLAMFVNQIDSQPVNFQFHDVCNVFSIQIMADALVKLHQFCIVKYIT